jgi:hypothetical protein
MRVQQRASGRAVAGGGAPGSGAWGRRPSGRGVAAWGRQPWTPRAWAVAQTRTRGAGVRRAVVGGGR